MAVPLIVVVPLILGGIGYAASKTADAAEETTQLVKWAAVGGGLYVSYKVLQSTGAIK